MKKGFRVYEVYLVFRYILGEGKSFSVLGLWDWPGITNHVPVPIVISWKWKILSRQPQLYSTPPGDPRSITMSVVWELLTIHMTFSFDTCLASTCSKVPEPEGPILSMEEVLRHPKSRKSLYLQYCLRLCA